MLESQKFTKALDFIKFYKKISFVQIAQDLGVENHLLTNIRRDQTQPSTLLEEKLIELHPDVAQFFITDSAIKHKEDRVEESMVFYSDGKAWKQLAETQEKLIKKQEEELERLKKENDQLKGENRALKDVFSERKKLKE